MEDLTNIWNDEDAINEEELLKYLQGHSSADEQHHVERKIAESGFESDAIDGLQQLPAGKNAALYVYELNKRLQQQLAVKKQKKAKRKIPNLSWIITAVILILALCILGYLVIKIYGS